MRLELTLVESDICPIYFVPDRRRPGQEIRRGGFVSANRVVRHHQGIARPSQDALDFMAAAGDRARIAAALADWDAAAPRYEVWLTGWNVRFDVDNMPKAVLDAFNGILWPTDHYIGPLHVDNPPDWGPVRYELAVETREARTRGRRPAPGALPLF